MRQPTNIRRMVLLMVAAIWLQPLLGMRAQAQETFSAACAFDGGRVSFIVSGENAQAGITRPNAVLKYADETNGRDVYVTSDIRRPAILVVTSYLAPTSSTAMGSRAIYVIDTERGSFSHIVENRIQQDNSTFAPVQGGTCSVVRSQK